MVKQVIEIGTAPAGQDGDTNREASIKINSNFTELYVAIGNVVRGPSMAIGGEVAVFSGTTGKDIVGGGVLGSAAFRTAGAANGVATLGADGKLPAAQLPPLAVNEVFTVASQTAMLALTAERGDVAVRSDQAGKTYILSQDDPASLANWVPLQQAMSAALAALNALTPAQDRIPYFTGATTAALLTLNAVGKLLLAAQDGSAARSAISAAKSGSNSDITELTGLTAPIPIAQGGVSEGYIQGLIPTWNSANSITVGTGVAWIPGISKSIKVSSPITLSGLTLSAATWYYIYLYDNAGTPAIEFVTDAPSTPYSGHARTKTGDNTRRFIAALRVQESNSIRKFFWSEDYINYLDNSALYPVFVSFGGTTATNFPLSNRIPPITRRIHFQVYGPATGGTLSIGDSAANALVSCSAGVRFMGHMIAAQDQSIFASHNAAVTGGSTLDIRGYGSER